MKKVTFLLFALVLSLSSIQAHAFTVPAGDWNAHFSDFSNFYRNGVPQPIGTTPQAGDYIKGIITLDSVIPKGGGLPVWTPSPTEQIAGYEYNLPFLGLQVVGGSDKTYWGSPTSRIDFYQRNPYAWNTGAGFVPQTGPEAVDSGVNNNTPAIAPNTVAGIDEAAFAQLFLGLGLLDHPDQTFAGAKMVLTGNILTGTGSGDAYADAVAGWFANSLEHKLMGPAGIPADFYFKFSYNVNAPLFGWQARSEDPADFSVVPEPGTIILLGTGLLGLGFFARRRKS